MQRQIQKKYGENEQGNFPRLFFYVLLAVHLSIILDNDQLDTHLLYITVRLL